MKTAAEIIKENDGVTDDNIIQIMHQYALECIKEDRKNLAENALVDVEVIMGQKTGYVSVDKDSIINAPLPELL